MRFIVYSILLIFNFSCSNKNKIGPEGPAGQDGSTILNGIINPTDDIGNIGDYYLNIESKHLFGPKKENGWGTGISLKGEKGNDGAPGIPGTPGNSVLSGLTTPSNQTGKIGDFYINISKMDFYGPKTADGWGTPISIAVKKGLEKRVLIKANFGYSSNCDICSQYVPASSSSAHSIFTSNSAEETLKPGDINEYYEKGIVTYEASINNGEWITLDPSYSRPILHNFKVGDKEYYITFYPNQITYSTTQQELKFGIEREIRVPSLYSKAQLIEWLNNDLKIDIKITLLPKDNIEYLSKTPTQQHINLN